MIQKQVGDKIRKARLAQGLSQEAVALAADINRTYFGSVERGERNISLVNLQKITRALNTSLSDLFKGL